MGARETRDQFRKRLSSYLEAMFSLTAGEHEARQQFENLTMETYDHLAAAGQPSPSFSLEPTSALNFINSTRNHEFVPDDVVQRWKHWKDNYPNLCERNPRLELHDMFHAIGETYMCESWPQGQERRLLSWLASGDYRAFPLDDRFDIITPEFFDRLRLLRERSGGWFLDGKFVCDADWESAIAAMDARRAAIVLEAKKAREEFKRQERQSFAQGLDPSDPDFERKLDHRLKKHAEISRKAGVLFILKGSFTYPGVFDAPLEPSEPENISGKDNQ
jgi:hypothetical protein